MAAFEHISLEKYTETFATSIELSSVALGGRIVDVSDDFFAEAHHLLLVEPAPSLKGQFGPKGALFSGWESRRHNPAYDWCIVKLGTTGAIFGFDVDTAHFSGNEAPEVSIDALFSPSDDPRHDDSKWQEILPKVSLGPSSRHLFRIPETKGVNYVKLNMYPDGGIARFRVYGLVAPIFPAATSTAFDLAHVFAGGRVVFTSDQHFGVGSNLILPGRGKDMGDGWETKRSRQKDHKDWAIIKLGTAGHLTHAEVDTAHFKGNFPESCELHGLHTDELVPSADAAWTTLLSRVKLGPHKQHFFQLESEGDTVYSHVRLTIHPDGGVKRLRLVGTRAGADQGVLGEHVLTAPVVEATPSAPSAETTAPAPSKTQGLTLPVLPLTAEAFAPFGQVIQAYSDVHGAPRGVKVTEANQGTAAKFHALARPEESYPAGSGARTAFSVFRCGPVGPRAGERWEVRRLERHPYTNQSFVPMGGRAVTGGEVDALAEPGTAYLVVVALNGTDNQPDLRSMRAFLANGGQGIVYDTGVWHHPMAVLGKTIDFTCIETQIGNGDKADCELVELDGTEGFYGIQTPDH